ncbi:unnamed protein product, partial [marine sediment metagenome]
FYDRFVDEYDSPLCCDAQKKIFGRSFDLMDPIEYEEFDDIVWDNIRRRGTGSGAVSKETPIKADILKKILIHADAKGKSMFLIMASGGLRIGELVNLKMEDVDFKSKPTKLTIRYRGLNTVKTKTSRIAFISDETTVALKEWLRIRTASLITASKRCIV